MPHSSNEMNALFLTENEPAIFSVGVRCNATIACIVATIGA